MVKNDYLKLIKKYADKYKYLLIIICAGIILLILPSSSDSKAVSNEESLAGEQYEEYKLGEVEKKISGALREIEGVGKTEVVLTLKSTMETVYQTDSQSNRALSETSDALDINVQTVTVSAGSGLQKALVVKRIYPEYMGALIVCEGGDRAAVRLEVTNAVSALTGLGSDKITVVKRNSG
ncbi:MAG: stage III sporulation protein AG [Oscillospiraceae bacterium]|nr:stage III sporulation protein AG [Oscillospiraceae bacterium]